MSQMPELPPMPTPEGTLYGPNRTIKGHAYTTETVRELLLSYGRACLEAAAQKVETMGLHKSVAATIRAMKEAG